MKSAIEQAKDSVKQVVTSIKDAIESVKNEIKQSVADVKNAIEGVKNDIKQLGTCDIGLIEGGLCNAENVHVLREFRAHCKTLVAVEVAGYNANS